MLLDGGSRRRTPARPAAEPALVAGLDEPASDDRHVRPAALRVNVWRDRDWFGIAVELKVEHCRIELAGKPPMNRR
jgi:hypothetical protein